MKRRQLTRALLKISAISESYSFSDTCGASGFGSERRDQIDRMTEINYLNSLNVNKIQVLEQIQMQIWASLIKFKQVKESLNKSIWY